MIICFIIKMHTLNAEFTRRFDSVLAARSQRAYGALEDPTAFCQTRCGNAKPRRLFWACSK